MVMHVNIDEVRRLSQDEGLNDEEIGLLLNCHRASVSRIRTRHKIPRSNLQNRKDKEQTCQRCQKISLVRRKQRIRKFCPSCRRERDIEILTNKRIRSQNKNKKHSEGMLLEA